MRSSTASQSNSFAVSDTVNRNGYSVNGNKTVNNVTSGRESPEGKNKNNMYTLVTGASSGIGKALALECASKGMNILLVALPGDELHALEKQIRHQYNVKCHTFGVDLSVHCSSTAVHNWVRENNFKVNVLINNVGVGSKGNFEHLTPDFYDKQIHLNVVTTCILTRLFVDDLKENGPSHI